MSSGAPMEIGTPIRYPATALMCVSTGDGFQYTKDTHELILGPNPSNLTINKGRTLIPGQFTRIAVTEAQVEWNIPNVNKNNNTLTIQLQDLSGSEIIIERIEIEPGFYSPVDLITEIARVLNTNPNFISEFTALGVSAPFFEIALVGNESEVIISTGTGPAGETVSAKLPKIVIALITPARAVARFNILSCAADPSITLLSKLQNDLTYMLGLTPTTFGSKSYMTIQSGYASFQYTPYVDLVSQTLTKNQKVSDSDSSDYRQPHKLARIYLANEGIQPFYASATYDLSGALVGTDDNVIGTTPFTFRREFKFPKQIQWNKDQYVDLIELQLLDSHGQYLPIQFNAMEFKYEDAADLYNPNLAEFRFTLQLSEQ